MRGQLDSSAVSQVALKRVAELSEFGGRVGEPWGCRRGGGLRREEPHVVADLLGGGGTHTRELVVEGRQRTGRRRRQEVRQVTDGRDECEDRFEIVPLDPTGERLQPRLVHGRAGRVVEREERVDELPHRGDRKTQAREIIDPEAIRDHDRRLIGCAVGFGPGRIACRRGARQPSFPPMDIPTATNADISRPGLGRWTSEPGDRSGRLEGFDVGGEVSGFVVDAAPGEGPPLHHHPYGETFVVLAGRGRFTVGETDVEATAGDVLSVAPGTPHQFRSVGSERLRLIAIHAAARIAQTDLAPAAPPEQRNGQSQPYCAGQTAS